MINKKSEELICFSSSFLNKCISEGVCVCVPCAAVAPGCLQEDPSEDGLQLCGGTSSTHHHQPPAPPVVEESDCETNRGQKHRNSLSHVCVCP